MCHQADQDEGFNWHNQRHTGWTNLDVKARCYLHRKRLEPRGLNFGRGRGGSAAERLVQSCSLLLRIQAVRSSHGLWYCNPVDDITGLEDIW